MRLILIMCLILIGTVSCSKNYPEDTSTLLVEKQAISTPKEEDSKESLDNSILGYEKRNIGAVAGNMNCEPKDDVWNRANEVGISTALKEYELLATYKGKDQVVFFVSLGLCYSSPRQYSYAVFISDMATSKTVFVGDDVRGEIKDVVFHGDRIEFTHISSTGISDHYIYKNIIKNNKLESELIKEP